MEQTSKLWGVYSSSPGQMGTETQQGNLTAQSHRNFWSKLV